MNIEQQRQNSVQALNKYQKARASRFKNAIKAINQVKNVEAFIEKFHLTEQKNEEAERHNAFEAQMHKHEVIETEEHNE